MMSPADWAVQHTPVAATQATISKAGIAGFAHSCTSITVTLAAVGAQAAELVFVLRDGASGAGTILWTAGFVAAATVAHNLTISGLNIKGTRGTAMTLETTAAPAATNLAKVSMTGRTEPDA
jgi:hypothetical protein